MCKRMLYNEVCSEALPSFLRGQYEPIQVRSVTYMGVWGRAIQDGEVTYIRLLLRVGIKVVDDWEKSLGYVRGSNIYVRGYLDLRAWSLRLRAQIEKNHYVKALFSSREWHFFLRWLRGILAIKRRACVSLRRGISGSWACDTLLVCTRNNYCSDANRILLYI